MHSFLFFHFESPSICSPFGVGDVTNMYVGNVTLTNNAGIAALAGKDGISGNLTVNAGVTSLAGLEDLRYIGGNFNLSSATAIPSFAGLENLTTVMANFTFPFGGVALTSVSALSKLQRIGGQLYIGNVDGLTSLDGAFPCLATIGDDFGAGFGGTLRIELCDSLTSMVGAFAELERVYDRIDIFGSALTTIAGSFPMLHTVNGNLDIDPSATLTALSLFPSLITVTGNLTVSGVVDFPAGMFPLLATTGSLELSTGSAVTTFPTFPALTTCTNALLLSGLAGGFSLAGAFPVLTNAGAFGGITLTSCTGLTSLANAFQSLTTCNTIRVIGSPNLTTLGGSFSVWNTTGATTTYLEFYDNGALNFANAFAGLTAIGYIEVNGVTGGALGAGNMANAFPALTTCRYVDIDDCDGLTTLAGAFPLLTTMENPLVAGEITGDIWITDCPALTSVASAFPSLVNARSLTFQRNNALVTFNAFAALDRLVGGSVGFESDGTLSITNNALLSTIPGLAGLSAVGKDIYIQSNAALTSIVPLHGISGAGFIGAVIGLQMVSVTGHAVLTTVAAQAFLDNLISEGYLGSTANSGNA